ncbi:MAG: hypothetical protein ACTSYT_00100, partial [Candidatus Asgardarchaeia archaeon]
SLICSYELINSMGVCYPFESCILTDFLTKVDARNPCFDGMDGVDSLDNRCQTSIGGWAPPRRYDNLAFGKALASMNSREERIPC